MISFRVCCVVDLVGVLNKTKPPRAGDNGPLPCAFLVCFCWDLIKQLPLSTNLHLFYSITM